MKFDLPQIISLLVGVVLPLLTGLVTKVATSPAVKAVVLLVLSGVTSVLTGFLASLTGGAPFELGTAVVAALGTFLVGVGMYFGIWKPTGAAVALQRVGSPRQPVVGS